MTDLLVDSIAITTISSARRPVFLHLYRALRLMEVPFKPDPFFLLHIPTFEDRVKGGWSNIQNTIKEILVKSIYNHMNPPSIAPICYAGMSQLYVHIDKLRNDLLYCVKTAREQQQPQAKGGQGNTSEQNPEESQPKEKNGINPAQEKAYQSYNVAIDKNPELAGETDKQVYDWLKENADAIEPYELPSHDTWQRYVRAGRKHYGTSKNTPRAGRTLKTAISVNDPATLQITSKVEHINKTD